MSVSQAKSSQRATALLGVSLSGEKLTPLLIFKRVPGKNGRIVREFVSDKFNYPAEMTYSVQVNAWMDEDTMLFWIEHVWKPWTFDKIGSTYLIMDEFSAHMTSKVLRALEALGTVVDFIIGGYTSRLQPLDDGINKPFKGFLRDQFEMFMVKNQTKNPDRSEVSRWVSLSWNSISSLTILNTWRRIGVGEECSEQMFSELQKELDLLVEEMTDDDLFDPANEQFLYSANICEMDSEEEEQIYI